MEPSLHLFSAPCHDLDRTSGCAPNPASQQGRTNMAFNLNHVHLKTRDPAATIRFYIENFGALASLREQGVRILEELPREVGRRVCFLEAPDGAQMEVIEKA